LDTYKIAIGTQQYIKASVASGQPFQFNQTDLTAFIQNVILSNICFQAGTPIDLDQGTIPIEQIDPAIHTINGKKIITITKTFSRDKFLVCFEKHALYLNCPNKRTIMSGAHKLFYQVGMVEAAHFVGKFRGVKLIKYDGEVLYNVLMENHEPMMVNNLICETLHPNNRMAIIHNILSALPPEDHAAIINKVNYDTIKQG
jgi:hypothetical protein